MARCTKIVRQDQTWGVVRYDILRHAFSYTEKQSRSGEPYANLPVVLNIVITRRCNMNCQYCVAKDFTGIEEPDLVLSPDMVRWINRSPFMVLVLTGGEPLMPPYDEVSIRLIESVRNRGVILDTNGTILPHSSILSCLKEHSVMVRVSMDSIRSEDEIELRHVVKGGIVTVGRPTSTNWTILSGFFPLVCTPLCRRSYGVKALSPCIR